MHANKSKTVRRVTQISESRAPDEQPKLEIDSIDVRLSQRLTWPIRWLHKQAAAISNRASRLLQELKTVGSNSQRTESSSAGSPPLHYYFDDAFYLRRNPGLPTTGLNPLKHYLDHGWKEGRSPHPLFDVRWYLQRNPDVAASGVEPLQHYVDHGWREGRSPHPLFDAKWYLEQNPTVSASGIEPLKHYLDHGWKEQRDPHSQFSVRRYLQENPDVKESGTEPLTHYVLFKEKDPRAAKSELAIDAIDTATLLRNRFPNLVPLEIFSASAKQRRVNTITDSISEGSLYGGAGTSIIFSVLLALRWDCPLRIITRTQQPQPRNVHDLLVANGIGWKRNIEFLYARIGDNRAAIDVSTEDIFVTTSWWTTWSTLQSIQNDRIIYLLQEDERLFYPEGDEKLRCWETISNSEIHIIVNSHLLYRHLVLEGFANLKHRGHWFEPSTIHSTGEKLAAFEDRKRRNFFFGARPGVNITSLFCLGLEVIENALLEGVLNPDEWTFSFVGKDLVRLRLNGNIEPTLIQNIKWYEYRKLISSMDLGLSLMSTPHPGYPALDLAAFGAVAVTNTFGIKTSLEAYSGNIICGSPTIHGLTMALKTAIPLVFDPVRRQQNRANDQILRDWKTSFEEPLNLLSREFRINK
jgi:hypothetical protein